MVNRAGTGSVGRVIQQNIQRGGQSTSGPLNGARGRNVGFNISSGAARMPAGARSSGMAARMMGSYQSRGQSPSMARSFSQTSTNFAADRFQGAAGGSAASGSGGADGSNDVGGADRPKASSILKGSNPGIEAQMLAATIKDAATADAALAMIKDSPYANDSSFGKAVLDQLQRDENRTQNRYDRADAALKDATKTLKHYGMDSSMAITQQKDIKSSRAELNAAAKAKTSFFTALVKQSTVQTLGHEIKNYSYKGIARGAMGQVHSVKGGKAMAAQMQEFFNTLPKDEAKTAKKDMKAASFTRLNNMVKDLSTMKRELGKLTKGTPEHAQLSKDILTVRREARGVAAFMNHL